MTEEEWMRTDWPLGELRARYEDATVDDSWRVHAFHNYWMKYAKAHAAPLSRAELEEILSNERWRGDAETIICECAWRGKVAISDAAWVLPQLNVRRWPGDQVKALLTLHDVDLIWSEKLVQLLEFRADWAANKILRALPATDHEEATAIIEASARYKSSKRNLLAVLTA